jgi:hypothetical protein
MTDQVQEKHQLSGLDTRERGFSRPVVFEQADGGYQAILRYETTRVMTTPQDTTVAALEELIRTLHEEGSAASYACGVAPILVPKSLGSSIRILCVRQRNKVGG